MVKGNLDATTPTLIRVHLRNTLQDVLGVEHEDFAWPLRRALKRIADEGTGVLVLLRKPENSRDLVQQIVSLNMQGEALHDGRPLLRPYGIGAPILSDLGVRSEERRVGKSGHGSVHSGRRRTRKKTHKSQYKRHYT